MIGFATKISIFLVKTKSAHADAGEEIERFVWRFEARGVPLLMVSDKNENGRMMNEILSRVPSPAYVIDETPLRRNLQLIKDVSRRAGVEAILAFKAFALWKTFPIFREYIASATASSLSEARLAAEEFGSPAHTFATVYPARDIAAIAIRSSHLTFNSLSQYSRLAPIALTANPRVKIGLRINPEYSEVGTALYNPCAAGSRLGITADKLPRELPRDVSGLHCHCHCESGADVLQRTLAKIEERFAPWLRQAEWLNLGGGHLLTREDYDIELFVRLMNDFRSRYPNLHVIIEPGSAFAWQTGVLVATVEDVVEDKGIRTAVLDVSFTCHMPDCLEMPYRPSVRGAETLAGHTGPCGERVYRLGGNSCLAGDFMGAWRFPNELKTGDRIVFEDMLHYTTVKTTMFNGVAHPAIVMVHEDGEIETLREFGYADYKSRMD